MSLTRREMLTAVCAGTALGLSHGGLSLAEAAANPTPGGSAPAPAHGAHEVQPLPFDAAKLKGISEKLITSHHDNNYAGAVKRLNLIQQQIGALPADAPPFQMGALKREELVAANSMLLHELYFGNLGGDGALGGAILPLLAAQYGSPQAWEQEFRLTGLSLAGGSGWVVLNYNPRLGGVHTYWSGDHTQNLAWGTPLLVMDMYEHSYQMDYGANAKGYIDAFFTNIDWGVVNRRAAATRGAQT